MGQAALMVPGFGPGVTKIDIDPRDLVLLGVKEPGELFNIPRKPGDIVHMVSPRFLIRIFNQTPPYPQHVVALVDADEIDFRMAHRHLTQKFTLAAAQIEENGLLFLEKRVPLPAPLFRVCRIIRARGQLRPGSFFFSHAHKTLLLFSHRAYRARFFAPVYVWGIVFLHYAKIRFFWQSRPPLDKKGAGFYNESKAPAAAF